MSPKSESINARPLNRLITILASKASQKIHAPRLWRLKHGITHICGVCIKVKPDDNLAEAHAMRLVAEHTSIPVPKVHCAFVHRNATYIVMSRIEGDMACYRWLDRPEESKAKVLAQLRLMVAQLRAVPAPEGAGVNNVVGGPFYDPRLPSSLFWGPFPSVRKFHEALVDNIDLEARYENLPPGIAGLF